MVIGENIPTIAERYRQIFIEKYGESPDPDRVMKDYRKYIVLLAFCTVLATFGTFMGFYRAVTINQSNAELILFLVGLCIGYYALGRVIAKILVIKFGTDKDSKA